MDLRTYLDREGLSLTAFARRIGIGVPTVHGYVTGRKRPSLETSVAIERATHGEVRGADFLPAAPSEQETSP